MISSDRICDLDFPNAERYPTTSVDAGLPESMDSAKITFPESIRLGICLDRWCGISSKKGSADSYKAKFNNPETGWRISRPGSTGDGHPY